MRTISMLLLPVLLLYIAYAGAMYNGQGSILFPAAKNGHQLAATLPSGAERVEIPVSFGHARAVYWRPRGAEAPVAAVWYAHGNFETVEDSFAMLQPLVARNIAVLQYEYPGYDGNDGAPRFDAIRESALATWDWLAQRPEVDATRMVAVGYSLGGGPAAALSRDRTARALVLISTFVSMGAMAWRHALPSFLVAFPYDNLARVSEFGGPVLVVHGRRDGVIPFAAGRHLAAASKQSRFVPLDCGHDDCDPAHVIYDREVPNALAAWGILDAAMR
jgi:pimeloyl-ACP methyl ester carboxylesterase